MGHPHRRTRLAQPAQDLAIVRTQPRPSDLARPGGGLAITSDGVVVPGNAPPMGGNSWLPGLNPASGGMDFGHWGRGGFGFGF